MTSPPNNHNGGPPDRPLTPASKLECIRQILDRTDLTAAQKCVGAGIVVSADREWVSEMRTPDLQRFASVTDRETVFRATKVLDTKGIVSKVHNRGQAGKFHVLPPSLISAIIDEYEATKSSRVKPDGLSGRDEWSDPVGFQQTTSQKAVGLKPTTRPEVCPPRAPAHARLETPSGLLIPKKDIDKTPLPPESEEPRVTFEKGQLVLFNGLKQYWLEEFQNDEKRLDLALKQAAGYVQPNSFKPLEAQVSSQLARVASQRRDQDKRYASAVKTNVKASKAEEPKESNAERWARMAAESKGAK